MKVLLLFDYILTRLAVYQTHNAAKHKKAVLYFQELILLCCPSPGFTMVVVADRQQQQHMQNNSDQSKSHQPNPLQHIYIFVCGHPCCRRIKTSTRTHAQTL